MKFTTQMSQFQAHWRASVLIDEFERFWEYKSCSAAANFRKRWETNGIKKSIETGKGFFKYTQKPQREYPHIYRIKNDKCCR